MAWSSAALSAATIALHNADKPCAVGTNSVRDLTSSTCQWRTGGSWAAGSTDTAALGPVDYLGDGMIDQVSYPTTSSDPHYLLFDFGAGGITFDAVFIIGHNFASIGGMVVTLQIDDLNTYAGATTLATWTPGTSTKRLAALEMDHVGASIRQYSAVRYARIKMDPTAASAPHVGEVIFATRRQLPYKPDAPWGDRARDAHWEETTSYGGRTNRVVHFRGRRKLEAHFTNDNTTYQDDLWSLYKTDTLHGTKPFMWIDAPHTAPATANMMMFPPEWDDAWADAAIREGTISGIEQGPTFVDLEA